MCATKKQSDSSTRLSFGGDVGLDPGCEAVHARFDGDPNSVVLAIVESVATVTDRDITALPPLFDVIDPEALTDLVAPSRKRPVEVCFLYDGCQVDVSSRGDVTVAALDR
ncbi:HalOD1 output domain-containing protein [Haloprofundus salilacus]|uniref:HalOD1 output domain-containing protein n=1 Tax=Haloprofundus salilacus TaxID=2876190 RepID=UPI001CCC49F9|nr:HalOD1 output domain-containing protein [Haloprofundus salilacus]